MLERDGALALPFCNESDGDNAAVRPVEAHRLRGSGRSHLHGFAVEPALADPGISPCFEPRLDRDVERARLRRTVAAIALLSARAKTLDPLVADRDHLSPPRADLVLRVDE